MLKNDGLKDINLNESYYSNHYKSILSYNSNDKLFLKNNNNKLYYAAIQVTNDLKKSSVDNSFAINLEEYEFNNLKFEEIISNLKYNINLFFILFLVLLILETINIFYYFDNKTKNLFKVIYNYNSKTTMKDLNVLFNTIFFINIVYLVVYFTLGFYSVYKKDYNKLKIFVSLGIIGVIVEIMQNFNFNFNSIIFLYRVLCFLFSLSIVKDVKRIMLFVMHY